MKPTLPLGFLCIVLLLVFSIQSCVRDAVEFEQDKTHTSKSDDITPYGETLILGEQLENPFSIENMEKALDSLKRSKNNAPSRQALASRLSQISIRPTHLYIKLILKDSMDLFKIEADTTLVAYDHPLDYDIVQMGDFYHDPEVPVDQPTPQYAAVRVDQTLPEGVDYEVLSDLYLPEAKEIGEDLAIQLEDAAMAMTGNLEEDEEDTNLFILRRKWRPAGRIQVWDDNIGGTTSYKKVFSHYETYDCSGNQFDDGNGIHGPLNYNVPLDMECQRAVYKYVSVYTPGSYVPMEGVKVRARRWFRTHTGITNAQGYYSCNGRYRGKARYLIKWKRHQFTIRWSWLSAAKNRGPRKRGDWNLNIRGGTQEYYATIFRAAHHYYYKDIKGLRRPPQNLSWRTKLKIKAKYENNGGSNGNHKPSRRFWGLGSAIKIYNPHRETQDIYSTVIHELAHASHWRMDRGNYLTMNYCKDTFLGLSCSGDPKVAESWARGVEWELTRMIYPGYEVDFYCNSACGKPGWDYTGVVQDMIDNDNRFGDSGPFREVIRGYTIRQLEDALIGIKKWNDWKKNIKKKYYNATENNLDGLFDYWN